MIRNPNSYVEMPVGVVVRRTPGVTRWAKWAWKAIGVLPGAAQADWRILREEDGATEFHAATCSLELHGAETEAYLHGLWSKVPAIYIVLRESTAGDRPLDVLLVTASPYEAQDYADSGEEIIEKVPMPDGLKAWVQSFVDTHHEHEEFKKRRRDKKDVDLVVDGVGDPRISQLSGVYRSPALTRKGRLQ